MSIQNLNKNSNVKLSLNFVRIIGKIEGIHKNPTVIIFAGVHGNEQAGVIASQNILQRIKDENISLEGNLYLIFGNIEASKESVRFKDKDLNRIWNKENIEAINSGSIILNTEVKEQIEIHQIIKDILTNENGPFYFIDLHTTSSPTVPFITISDSLNNRKFSSNFPVPVVLGIEEYLDGPLLTFINEFGHVALGFEGGEHNDPQSVTNSEAFIWQALVHSKCLLKQNITEYKKHKSTLDNLCCTYEFFEIKYRYEIKANENFNMYKGFVNFEKITKNQSLAQSDGVEIKANMSGRIFMPLYQDLGDDGYFILNKISVFWLKLSTILRKLKINNFLRLIPGVTKAPENNYTLIVNPRIAKYLAKDIFHLFGYRKHVYKDNKLYFAKRDRDFIKFD